MTKHTKSKNNYINGPLNVVRLEGDINGVNKVLYVFMDMHYPVQSQTKCPGVVAKDIVYYFIDEFIKTEDKTIDFFLEYRKDDMENAIKNNTIDNASHSQYISEVTKFIWDYKRLSNKEKEKREINFDNNVRVHHLDIRDKLYTYGIRTEIHEMSLYAQDAISGAPYKIVERIFIHASNLKTILNFVLRSLVKYDESINIDIFDNGLNNEVYNNEKKQEFEKLLEKIFTKYKKKENYKKIKELYNTFVDKTFEVYKGIDDIMKKTSDILDKVNTIGKLGDDGAGQLDYMRGTIIYHDIIDLKKIIDIYVIKIMDAFVDLTDMYFLRRFIDKEYITNAISYTGILHSSNYIYILVKHFNMKITHASYCEKDLADAEKIIKKSRVLDNNIHKLFWPPEFSQCSNVGSFPTNFS